MNYINASEYPLADMEQEKELIIKAQAGNKEASDYLILSNTPLVKFLIKKWSGKGIEADDLFQVGCMGLMRAIKAFDASKNVKFSSYAYMWIENRMMRTIQNESRTIRIPVHAYQRNFGLMVATKILEQELEKEPTVEELAEYTHSDIEEIKRFRFEIVDTCSINEMASSDSGQIEKGASLPSDIDIENEVTTDFFSNELMKTIKNLLTEKEYKIFCMRTGFGCEPQTYDVIAKEFNVTKQRIQQIYRTSTDRLKRSKKVKLYKCS